MRILISGGAGFVGSHSANLLVERGHKVLIVDDFSTGRSENLKDFQGKIRPCDITDLKFLESVFSEFQPNAVLHLAAQSAISTAIENPQKDLTINGIGTLNMLKLACKYNVKRFVFSSTSAVYREARPLWSVGIAETWPKDPSNPYGISKLACEHYVRTMFPNHMILRYGNIYGPRQRSIGNNQVVARALEHFILGTVFKVNGHGNQKRDFVYVGDVAYANFTALTETAVGTFNVSSGKSYSVNEILTELEKIYDVRGYEWEHTKENDPRNFVRLNVSAIRREVGWKSAVSLADGLKLTADWWDGQKC
jgi:nucleoside-diphosphate-sugar epimerase